MEAHSAQAPGADHPPRATRDDGLSRPRDLEVDLAADSGVDLGADLEARLRVAALIGDWLADTSQRPTRIPRDQLSAALRRAIPPASEGGAAGLARRLGAPKTTFWGWVHGRWPMAFSALVALCQLRRCAISAFLADPAAPLGPPLDPPDSPDSSDMTRGDALTCRADTPAPTLLIDPALDAPAAAPQAGAISTLPAGDSRSSTRLHHGRRDEQRLEQIRTAFALRLAPVRPDVTAPPATPPTSTSASLAGSTGPVGPVAGSGRSLTARDVAAQLQVTPRTLRAYAPDLYALLLERGRQERAERKQRRATAIRTIVRQAALEVAAMGEWPTYRRVGISIGKPGVFRERGAREALAAVWVELEELEDQAQESGALHARSALRTAAIVRCAPGR